MTVMELTHRSRPLVVPAQAGTHTPQRMLRERDSAFQHR